MLPIILHPEPQYFDNNIRQPGIKWLKNNPYAKPEKFPKYWTKCLSDMHEFYKGICCYYAIYIEEDSGAESIDHFNPKSIFRQEAYEWNNLRFCCLQANRRKRDYDDIIDPLKLTCGLFKLDFITGEIYPDSTSTQISLLESTINRLKLNNPKLCKTRISHYLAFLKGDISAARLQARSPFVYMEAIRQQLI